MKTQIVLAASLGMLLIVTMPASSQSLSDRLKAARDKAAQKAADAASAATKEKPAAEPAASPASEAPATPAPVAADVPVATTPGPVSITAYQNYDFVPGDTIVFADDFTGTQDGEFPDQWDLVNGQGVVNKQAGRSAMLLTEGNYVRIGPRVKSKSYLGAQYTVEYDTFVPNDGAYGLMVFLKNDNGPNGSIQVSESEADYNNGDSYTLSASLPTAILGEKFRGNWHHVAVAVKNNQLKTYVDQYRVLTVPDMHNKFSTIEVGGIGAQDHPIVFTNLRLASGGNMNTIGQKFTDAKIVTHGINFDVDQATLRPESMGTLNMIKRVMTDNPDLKFEIDGHTDNSGASTHNLTLSQRRAEAVKTQLVTMGIDVSRLTTTGLGDTKPIASNDTPEGKANNRRVEFVKIS
jgi:OmpA-OmpF porin, OOP family